MKRFYLAFFMLAVITPVHILADATQDNYATANQFYNNQDYLKAIDYYQKVLSLDPQNVGANIGLGNSYYQLWQKGKSLTYYQKALELDPNNTQVSSMVANLKSRSQPTTMTFMVPSTESLPSQPGETKQQKPMIDNQAHNVTSELSSVAMKPFKRLELGLIGSLDIPNNGGEIGGFGFGGRVTGGYRLDPAFSLLATLAYLNFNYSQMLYQTGSGIVATNTGNSNTTIFEFLGGLKYRFGSTPIHPYFLAGVGISNLMTNSENTEIVNGVTTSSTSQATNNLYPVAEIGGGLEFPLADDMNIFFQAQYGVVLILSRTTTQTSSGNTNINTINGSVFTDVPMEMGLNFNL